MRNAIAIVTLVWAIALSVTSLFIPPQGVIDGSVLVLLAQILVFMASVYGIKLPDSFNLRHGNSSSQKVAS